MTLIQLPLGEVLYQPGSQVRHVYIQSLMTQISQTADRLLPANLREARALAGRAPTAPGV